MALSEQQMAAFMQAQQQEAREQVLYQFNCGRMTLNGKTVTPQTAKGKVVLSMEDDGLLRFQWRLRHKDENELQCFIFPGGATWTKVQECKDGSVFLLKMRDSDVKHFFWSQEPRADPKKQQKKDAEILKRVNALITTPPVFGAPLPKEEEEPNDEDEAMTDVSSVSVPSAGGIALVQGTGHPESSPVGEAHRGVVVHPSSGAVAPPTAGAAAPATGAPAPAGGSASAQPNQPLNANALMSTLNAMAQQLQARQDAQVGMEDILDSERVQPILDVDSALVDALVEYLPEGQRSPEALRAQLRSPQMQQTMHRLTQILNSSQFGQLMASLSLPVGATTGLGVDAFIAAINEQAKKQAEKKK